MPLDYDVICRKMHCLQGKPTLQRMIRLKELYPADKHRLNAAKGWLELGDLEESRAELTQIHPLSQRHPEVLKVKWKLCARRKKWPDSLEIAEDLIRTAADQPSSWICLSFSLFNSSRNQEAWKYLLQAEEQFPKVSAIPYFLARLSCKMGNLEEATLWINKWNKMVDKDSLKDSARKDPVLTPLWKHMKKNLVISSDFDSESDTGRKEGDEADMNPVAKKGNGSSREHGNN